jgi:PIN domain nuclease of toxin-antitoxin system
MNFLLDSHLLLWATTEPQRLSDAADALIRDAGNSLYFSVVSIWEVVIKAAKHRSTFTVDRVLLAQAKVEGIPLVTVDEELVAYPAPVICVP